MFSPATIVTFDVTIVWRIASNQFVEHERGKCWLFKKHVPVTAVKYINDVISYAVIDDNVNTKIMMIGVHIPYDDGSKYRYLQYKSTLEFITALLQENLDKLVMITGDFNSDLERNRRYDTLLNDFISEHELVSYEYIFHGQVKYTYKNAELRNHIDHILGRIDDKNRILNCEILEDASNMSDHNAISIEIERVLMKNQDTNELRNFHKFNWYKDEFIYKYNECLEIN